VRLLTNGRSVRRAGLWMSVTALLAVVVTACSSTPTAVVTVTVDPNQANTTSAVVVPGLNTPTSDAPASSSTATSATGAGVRFTLKPGNGTKNVAPNDPASITVFAGTIADMSLTGDDGTTISGQLSADKSTWTTNARMNYNMHYTFKGDAAATVDGSKVPVTGSFTTINPAKTMGVQVNIPNGGTVGIAAPIIVTFLGPVQDKAAAEKALTVITSAGDKVQGNWAWVQDEDFQNLGFKQSQAHWRPTAAPSTPGASDPTTPYWPANTVVQVQLNLKGVNFGNGIWGKGDFVTFFKTRPDAQIVRADAQTYHMVVMVNGQVSKNYAVSYGKESVPGRATVNGIHVVTKKDPTYAMCNPQFDYCNALEKWAVRINNNGEFIHENLLAKAAFGIANVSHGCINMGEPDAQNYYNSAMYGDPVEVSNTGGPNMTEQDALYDWIYSPTQWKSMSALG
jgi:lipoprotein-anchoring transpeptidase ErfK/SrfK